MGGVVIWRLYPSRNSFNMDETLIKSNKTILVSVLLAKQSRLTMAPEMANGNCMGNSVRIFKEWVDE